MRLLVTGGCGFVGSNFIRYVLQHYGPEMVTNVDALTTGHLSNLAGLAESCGDRYEFLHADVADLGKIEAVLSKHQYFAVVHFAAETAGVAGTSSLLERARRHGIRRFLLVSKNREAGELAAAEAAALKSHLVDHEEVVITRSTDNYGPFQPPTSLIPRTIVSALRDQPVKVTGDGSRMRDWLHVEDHCAALFTALLDGAPGTIHPFASGHELRDIDLVERILEQLGKSRDLIEYVPENGESRAGGGDAPSAGHSDPAALPRETLAWKPRRSLEQGLHETIDWYVRNRAWWEALPAR